MQPPFFQDEAWSERKEISISSKNCLDLRYISRETSPISPGQQSGRRGDSAPQHLPWFSFFFIYPEARTFWVYNDWYQHKYCIPAIFFSHRVLTYLLYHGSLLTYFFSLRAWEVPAKTRDLLCWAMHRTAWKRLAFAPDMNQAKHGRMG